jgi:hypothetical protein
MFDEAKRKQKACCVLAVEAGDVGASAMRDCRGCHEVVGLTPTRSTVLIFAWLLVRIITKSAKHNMSVEI